MMPGALPAWAVWACGAWCVLALIWLWALGADVKAKWMHRLHALLPVGAMVALLLLPPEAMLASWLRTWLLAGAFIVAFLTPVWLVTLATRNSGVMDVVYSPTAVVPVAGLILLAGEPDTRGWMVLAVMGLWSARLIRHASATNLGVKGEQQPYASWRTKFGGHWWWWSYFQVFLLQGGIVWIWVLPLVFFVETSARTWGATDYLGLAVWVVGFFFQAVGDWQLKRFKQDPANKGQVLQSGLWSLTRHPNYFGEATMWLGYCCFGFAHPWGALGLLSVAYVTWFMSRGSAAAMLDRHMLRTKPAYADYVRRVPGFCPFFKSSRDEALLQWAAARQARS